MTFALAAQWALKNWKLVLGGLALVTLGLMLAFAKMDAAHWHGKYDNAEVGRLNEIKAHAVTRASVDTLQAALASKNAESMARAQAFEQVKAESAGDVAAANARYASTAAARDRLQALAGKAPAKVCVPPAELMAGLSGL